MKAESEKKEVLALEWLKLYNMTYYVVKYSGPFGFIKPWTAVRDGETFSQQFLTPSIVEGIEKKLFPELLNEPGKIQKILRHRLSYEAMDMQQEQTQTRGWKDDKKSKTKIRNKSVLIRGVMLNPVLHLAFASEADALAAAVQHVCLCRNEDVLIPYAEVLAMSEDEFNMLDGYELHFEKTEQSFLVGYNRFDDAKPMFGWLEISGKPVFNMK